MTINYELLKTFVAAGSARTFGEAAAQRRVSVSAISQQVKILEAQLGVPLFERLGRRVRLTASGRALLETLREELGRIDAALEAASSEYARIRGTVRIGAPQTFGGVWLRPRLASLLAQHEELRAVVELGVPSILERHLVDGALDLAVLVRSPEASSIASEPIATETFVAVAAPSYLERAGTPRTLSDFQQRRWIVFDSDLAMHAPWWRATFGARAALPTDIVCEISSLEHMMALAIDGSGLAVLPDYLIAAAIDDRRLRVMQPTARARAQNTIYLAWRRTAMQSARMQAAMSALRSSTVTA